MDLYPECHAAGLQLRAVVRIVESSGARESHPRALPKLDVTVSRHPAPIVQP